MNLDPGASGGETSRPSFLVKTTERGIHKSSPVFQQVGGIRCEARIRACITHFLLYLWVSTRLARTPVEAPGVRHVSPKIPLIEQTSLLGVLCSILPVRALYMTIARAIGLAWLDRKFHCDEMRDKSVHQKALVLV